MADGILKVGTITTSSGSGSITIGQSGETITFPSGCTITNNGTQTGFGGVNTPAVVVHGGTDAYGGSNTWTKVQLDTELLDTESSFDTSNYRWTPQTAGKYIYTLVVYGLSSNAGNANLRGIVGYISKNGSDVQINEFDYKTNDIRQAQCVTTATIDMNGSSDYVEFYGEVNTVDGVQGRFSPYTMARGWRLTS